MASESITFDFISRGADRLAGDFKRAGDNAASAARGAKVLQDTIGNLGQKENRTAEESARLAKALRLTGDAEDRAAAKALAADIAIRRLADAEQDAAKKAGQAKGGFAGLAGEITGFGAAAGAADSKSSLFARGLAGINLATGVLEPALAGVVVAAGGMAAAFASAGIGAGVFGVVAGGVFAKAKEGADKFTKSQDALNAATTSAQRQKALADQKAAFQGLNSSQVQLAKGILSVKDQWSKFLDSASPGVVGPAVAAMGLLPRVFQIMKPFLAPVEQALTGIIGEIQKGIAPGSQFSKIMGDFAAHSGTTLKLALETAGHLFMGLLGVLHAFLPAGQGILVWAEQASEKFQKWGLTLSQHTGFQSLMTMFKTETPQAMAILRNLGTVLLNVGKAMTGLSGVGNSKMLLQALLPLSGILATLSQNTALVRITLYLVAAHSAASKLIPAFQGVKAGITGIGVALKFASANPIVLLAAAVIALGVAFYEAWEKFAGFRDAIKLIGTAMIDIGIVVVQVNKTIVDTFLSMIGTILHAAATAFGWVPGLGDKLRGASAAFDGFKASVDSNMQGAINKMNQWKDNLNPAVSATHDGLVKIQAGFDGQSQAAGRAKTAMDTYTAAMAKNGADSAANQPARQALIRDLTNSGVNANTAKTDVDNYTASVRRNGADSAANQPARAKLIVDIAGASSNARQGKADLANYSASIAANAGTSDKGQAARAKLIADLVKSGMSSSDATTLVKGLGTSISNLPASKKLELIMKGDGTYYINAQGQSPVNKSPAAAGLFIRTGTGPTADDVPLMASRGELVVPARMVAAGAVDHLRGRIPGFASGGLAGGVDTGFPQRFYNATQKQMTDALVAAMRAAIEKAAAAAQAAAASGTAVPNVGSGIARWAGLVRQALAMEGLSQDLALRVLYQMQTESAGNPNAINLWDCITLDYVILTKRGWLRHDQVQAGDETIGYNPETRRSEWTLITRVVRYEDAEVWRIGNKHWHADVTPNHRWWSDTLTCVQPAFSTCPECGWLPRGSKNPARGVQVHRNKIHGIAAARPQLNTLRGEFVRTEDLRSGHRVRLAAPADTDGIPGLSLEETRIIAWLQGDGTVAPVYAKPELCPECGWAPGDARRAPGSQPANAVAVHRARKHGKGKDQATGELAGYDGIIWQSKPAQIIKLRALLAGVEHTEAVRQRPGNTQPAHAFRLRRAYVTDLLKRSRLIETGPEAFVLALSPDQRASWLDSMIDAEGHRQPVAAEGARRGASGEFVRIAQVNGPLQDAIKLAVFLEGYRPTFSALSAERHGYQPSGHVGMARPHIAPSMFTPHKVLERQPVWCVTTELGTWTTKGGDDLPFLTGNSNAAAGHPSKGLLTYAGHRPYVRGLPLAWDQQQHLRPARQHRRRHQLRPARVRSDAGGAWLRSRVRRGHRRCRPRVGVGRGKRRGTRQVPRRGTSPARHPQRVRRRHRQSRRVRDRHRRSRRRLPENLADPARHRGARPSATKPADRHREPCPGT